MRPATQARDPRSLAPREHGAYGQLFVPLVTALAMGRPTIGAAALAIAGTAVFFAHEPALVRMGRRGPRAQREDGARARSRLSVLGAIALAGGAAAVTSAPATAIASAVPLLPAAGVVGWLALRGDEKTAGGETLAAAVLSGAGVPVAMAAGVPVSWALGAWVAWVLAFGASTLAVRAVIAHAKTPIASFRRVLPPLFAALVALAAIALVPWWCAAAAGPMILVSLALAISPPPPRSLRRVGWTLVASSVAAAVILVAGARLAA